MVPRVEFAVGSDGVGFGEAVAVGVVNRRVHAVGKNGETPPLSPSVR